MRSLFLCISRLESDEGCSVELLEAQISDLQSEASRLIRSLDAQTEKGEREQREGAKKVEELVREKEVRVKEVEGLKERLRQYADYDEVKRELEIMKVRTSRFSSFEGVRLMRSWSIVRRVCGDGRGGRLDRR